MIPKRKESSFSTSTCQSTVPPSSSGRNSTTSLTQFHDGETTRKYSTSRRERENSAVTVSPKMMRRRFSEQLILEGGLGGLAKFSDFDDENPDEENGEEESREESATGKNARKKLTLKGRYYPEGGWGWIVVFVNVTVQILSHGLQFGFGSFIGPTMNRFLKTLPDMGESSRTGIEIIVLLI